MSEKLNYLSNQFTAALKPAFCPFVCVLRLPLKLLICATILQSDKSTPIKLIKSTCIASNTWFAERMFIFECHAEYLMFQTELTCQRIQEFETQASSDLELRNNRIDELSRVSVLSNC